MIEHHVIIAKMLKERLESKENQNNQNNQNPNDYDDYESFDDSNQGTVETVRMEDINEEDFSFKTAKESQFKFVDDEDY